MNKSKYNIFIQDDSHHHIPDFNHFINYCNNCIINNIDNVNYDDKCIFFISKIISFFINKNSFILSNKMRLS